MENKEFRDRLTQAGFDPSFVGGLRESQAQFEKERARWAADRASDRTENLEWCDGLAILPGCEMEFATFVAAKAARRT